MKKNSSKDFLCKYCKKECKNLNSLRQHEIRCKENPDKIKTGYESNPNANYHSWNKGLTKETDKRIAKASQTLKNNIKSGKVKVSHRKHTEEEKKKISEARKKYLKEHPDKVPYLLNHSSKISYPEQYFIDLFKKENINLKYHKQVGVYQLDFYNEDLMKYIEIDGQTHSLDKVKEIDQRRTEFLSKRGWEGLRISWSQYQSLTKDGKKDVINQIKNFLLNKSKNTNNIEYKNYIKNKKEQEEKRQRAIEEGKIDKNGHIRNNILSEKEWEERLPIILNTKIDLTKYGWLSKILKMNIGLSGRQIVKTLDHFNIKYYKLPVSNISKEEYEDYLKTGPHYCKKCGKKITEKFGSGKYCSRNCANGHKHSEQTKNKIKKSMRKHNKLKKKG